MLLVYCYSSIIISRNKRFLYYQLTCVVLIYLFIYGMHIFLGAFSEYSCIFRVLYDACMLCIHVFSLTICPSDCNTCVTMICYYMYNKNLFVLILMHSLCLNYK